MYGLGLVSSRYRYCELRVEFLLSTFHEFFSAAISLCCDMRKTGDYIYSYRSKVSSLNGTNNLPNMCCTTECQVVASVIAQFCRHMTVSELSET